MVNVVKTDQQTQNMKKRVENTNNLESIDYKNPNYLVTLETTELNKDAPNYVKLETYVPESFAVRLSSDYENSLKNFVEGLQQLPAGALRTFGRVGDVAATVWETYNNFKHTRTLLDNISSFPNWTGNSPLEFDIPFKFDAIYNTRDDVIEPMKALMLLVVPELEGNVLNPPGPKLKVDWNNSQEIRFKDKEGNPTTYAGVSGIRIPNISIDQKKLVTITIGKFFKMRGALVTNVDATFDSRFDKNGLPISATANVRVISIFPPISTDIKGWFDNKENYEKLGKIYDAVGLRSTTNIGASIKQNVEHNGAVVTNSVKNTVITEGQRQISNTTGGQAIPPGSK